MNFIDLKSQYKYLQQKIDTAIHKVLEHGKYIMGPEVFEFEQKLADFVGVKHAISCANGTDALQLCLMAINCSEGDAVFCPTFTFFATAESIAYSKATPVFVDSEKRSFNICPLDLEKRIQETIEKNKLKPKAIIAVDLFGQAANYPAIEAIAKKYNLILIEDAAQGLGAKIGKQRAGSFGDLATTSFFPAKPLGCYGDGGAVFTNNDNFADLIRSFRVHGKGKDKYDNIRIGINSRLDTIQAAILIEKLAEFEVELEKRNQVALNYNKTLEGQFIRPHVEEGYYSSWAQYTILCESRLKAQKHFEDKKIPTAIYYSKCMHEQTAFKYLEYKKGDFPIAEDLSNKVLSLPMSPYML